MAFAGELKVARKATVKAARHAAPIEPKAVPRSPERRERTATIS
jgi:hypothetical protein